MRLGRLKKPIIATGVAIVLVGVLVLGLNRTSGPEDTHEESMLIDLSTMSISEPYGKCVSQQKREAYANIKVMEEKIKMAPTPKIKQRLQYDLSQYLLNIGKKCELGYRPAWLYILDEEAE